MKPVTSILPNIQQPVLLPTDYQDCVGDPRRNQNQRQNGRAGVADLVRDREHHADQDEVDQCPGLPLGELEERDHQSNKARHRHDIEKGCHRLRIAGDEIKESNLIDKLKIF
jgi:hypothetical protein|nr:MULTISPECIES: hypothetical protein [Bradyrhizobium]